MTHHTADHFLFAVYFLPIWFQSILGVSAVDSGIRLLPLMLSMVLATVANGFFTQKIGYYTPSAIAGTCIMCVGAGLLTTLGVDAGRARWIGYQIPYGFGLGLAFQAPNLAAQTVLPTADVPVGTSLMFFTQLLGAAIFVSAGENVLANQLARRLSALPGLDGAAGEQVASGGATSLISSLPEGLRAPALEAYNQALRQVFLIGLVMSCLTILGTAGLEWRSTQKKKKPVVTEEEEEGSAAMAVAEGKEESVKV